MFPICYLMGGWLRHDSATIQNRREERRGGSGLKGGFGRSVMYSGFLIMKDDDLAVFPLAPSLGNPLPDYSERIKEEEEKKKKKFGG